jgi:hypothetical protein
MPDYRRAWHPGGTYFFTVNLLQQHGNIRTDADYRAHRNCAQHDLVRHGLVTRKQHSAQCPSVIAPYASLVEQGAYPLDWAGGNEDRVDRDDQYRAHHPAQCPSVIAPYANSPLMFDLNQYPLASSS